ncbi:MAG TPA: hypothetical protein VG738_22760 [Chitinophagaceae bacterium]|nr:hypothetical protein [Chitinophagaceae bacterium]
MKTGILFFLFMLVVPAAIKAQKPVEIFKHDDFTTQDSLQLLKEYGNNKVLPGKFALQALIALSYFPELKNTHIAFIVKPAYSLLQTRPVARGIFSRTARRFTITISDSSYWKLEPIRLDPMNFNAQIGVIGHELSHVSDFIHRSFINLAWSGVRHISSKYIDRFEYRTDSICIAHGLGYQLLAWSRFVRATLHTNNYDGADNIDKPMMHERYMNPATIMMHIKAMAIYNK